MQSRRRQGHIRQARRPSGERHARAPYAAGEDVGAAVARRSPLTGKHPRRVTHRADASVGSGKFSTGDEALDPSETQHARWRRPAPSRTALTTLTGKARVGASAGFSALTARLRRIPPRRLFSVGIPTALLVALLAWLLTGSYWQARAVRIQGTSDPAILALVHAQRLTGCNVFRCDFSAARQAIATSPLVQRVSVTIVYPETTLIAITQRQTVAIWRAQGRSWAVGADGVIIGSIERQPSLANASAAVVDDASGAAFAGQAPQPGARLDAALVAMASQLRKNAVGAGLDPTSLRYSGQDGFTLQASDGVQVVFGGPADARATLADYSGATPAPAAQSGVTPAQASQGAQLQVEASAAILTQLAQSHTSASLIDVRWGTRPYYR